MKKVILTKGLPGSGKSAWCKELIGKEPGRWKRVCKDDLRLMLDNSRWSPANEKYILQVRDLLILSALEAGFHVLVDDTNLHPKHLAQIQQLVRGKATIEEKDFTDVDIEVCIERDLIRPNSVGEQVIRKMHRQFLYKPPEPPVYDETLLSAIIYDLDGTVALHHHRNPYDTEKCMDDLPNKPVVSVIHSFIRTEMYYIAVSGREEQYRTLTKRWLAKHAIPCDALFMRPTGDQRRDYIIKREIYDREIAGKYNVHLVLDDRSQVIQKVWRALGLPCFQVADGDF